MRIFTWHAHSSYLFSLVKARQHEFFVPIRAGRPHPWGGGMAWLEWPDNLHEVPVEAVRDLELDVLLFPTKAAWLEEQYAILTPAQRLLPKIFLEHDPPTESPTDARHLVDDPEVLVVHVSHFNDLMWDSGRSPTRVIEHGVAVPDGLRWRGDVARGITVVHGLNAGGRRLGADLFQAMRHDLPLDLAGRGSEELGGHGDLPPPELWQRELGHRFFFSPIRHASMDMAVCEAMVLGLPIIGLATGEMPNVVENGVAGYIDTDVGKLKEHMVRLLDDPLEAAWLSEGARQAGRRRFDIRRFVRDWDAAFSFVAGARFYGVPSNAAR
jgi:hypothetical protein